MNRHKPHLAQLGGNELYHRTFNWASKIGLIVLAALLITAVASVPASADPRCQNNDPFYGFCVGGKILEEFNQAGGYSFFGNATNAESNTQNGGKFQRFLKNSSIYWHPVVSNGHANQIGGSIRDAWGRVGWETGYLGYPTTREFAVSGGRANHMMAGSIYWSTATGAHNVWLGIRDEWAADGYENGRWGFPIEDTRPTECDVWAQDFQGGTVLYNDSGDIDQYFLPFDDVDGSRLAYTVGDFIYPTQLQAAINNWNQLGGPVNIAPRAGVEITDVHFTTVVRPDETFTGRHTHYDGGIITSTIQINAFWLDGGDPKREPPEYTSAEIIGVITHEIGHALGLADNFCPDDLMAENDGLRGANYAPAGLTLDLYRNKWGF